MKDFIIQFKNYLDGRIHTYVVFIYQRIYYKLTCGTVKGWSDLVGILFQPPSEAEVKESFRDYMERLKEDKDDENKIIRSAPLVELTLEEMNSSLIIEGNYDFGDNRIVRITKYQNCDDLLK